MSDKVSIIIPMYNSQDYIEQCIQSVIHQTYKNIEIIVVDDASTDESVNVIKSIKDDRIILITFKENKGVSAARNKGIEIATGEYICFLDSDDIWINNKIEKQIKFIKNNDYDFIYSDYIFLNTNTLNNIEEYKRVCVPKILDYNHAIKNTTIFISSVMLNVKTIKKEDIIMPNLKIGQDTVTWWHILKSGIIAHGMNEVLVCYRVRKRSLSSNKLRAIAGAWKIYSMQGFNFFKIVLFFLFYLKNAIKRRI